MEGVLIMPDDNRLDLTVDLDKLGTDLLKDVKAATEQVKQRNADDKAKEAKSAEKEQSKKLQVVIIAAAAVILLIVAYFTVFAKDDASAPATHSTVVPGAQSNTSAPIRTPGVTQPGASRTNRPANANPAVPAGRSNQATDRPSDDYEQPNDPGM